MFDPLGERQRVRPLYLTGCAPAAVSSLKTSIIPPPPDFLVDDNTVDLMHIDPEDRTALDLEQIQEQFMDVPFFAALTPLQQLHCCRSICLVSVQAGQRLYDVGDPGDSFYVTVHGKLRMEKLAHTGAVISTLPLRVGDSFGDKEMTNHEANNTNVHHGDELGRRTNRVVADADSQVLPGPELGAAWAVRWFCARVALH